MHWIDDELRRQRGQRVVNMLAEMLLNKSVDYDILGLIYRPKDKIPTATVKRLIKQAKFMEAVNKKVVELLNDAGGTKEYLIKFRLECAQGAKKDEKWKEAAEIIGKLEDVQEITPKSVRVTQTDELTVSRKEGDMLEQATKKTTKQLEAPEHPAIDAPKEEDSISNKED